MFVSRRKTNIEPFEFFAVFSSLGVRCKTDDASAPHAYIFPELSVITSRTSSSSDPSRMKISVDNWPCDQVRRSKESESNKTFFRQSVSTTNMRKRC